MTKENTRTIMEALEVYETTIEDKEEYKRKRHEVFYDIVRYNDIEYKMNRVIEIIDNFKQLNHKDVNQCLDLIEVILKG